eukprot:XP_011666980.1 PREDICTED: uncharacterized protein LOC105439548 [Strongylocentrotus purpuratus]
MNFCNLVLRKKRNILASAVILASLCFGYYLVGYGKVCVISVSSFVPESNLYYKGYSQGVVRALDHGCYLQTSNFSQYQHSEEILAKRNCTQKIPIALILGAALSGSATLKSALSFHPDVVVSEFGVPFKDNDQYLDKMPYSLPHQMTVGECQEYLYMSDLSKQTWTTFSPDLKVIILVRDPVARAMSEYLVLTSNSSSEFYRRSLSQYPDVPIGAPKQESRARRIKRNVNTRPRKDNTPHREERTTTASEIWKGKGKNSLLHKTSPDNMHYSLEDTFEETVLESSEIDAVHFLVQRSIYASSLKRWAVEVSRLNILVLDAERFAKSPAVILDSVERFLGLRQFFHKDFFNFDLPQGVFCFNSPVRSCVEPIPMQEPLPSISEEVVALFRQFFIPAMKVQNRISGAYFPHLGENPLIFTPFR